MAQMRRIAKPMSRPKQRVTVEMLLYSATPLPGASRVSSCVKSLITTWGSGSLCLYVFMSGHRLYFILIKKGKQTINC